MPNTLVFPDGVRLALKHEIPGSEAERSAAWDRIERAKIAPGYSIRPSSQDSRFSRYAEINVDAPIIWPLFNKLCHGLLGPKATLVASEVDGELRSLGSASISLLTSVLERHQYQLVNDGSFSFGLYSDDEDGSITEIVITATKHFEVWFDDEEHFLSVMKEHGLSKAGHIEFLDEYPHVIVSLRNDAAMFPEAVDLMRHLEDEIAARVTASASKIH